MKKLILFLCLLFLNSNLIAAQNQTNGKANIKNTTNITNNSVKKVASITYKTKKKVNKQIVQHTATTTHNIANDNLAIYAVDAVTGQVLFSRKAYEIRYPASLTKLMTLYILFEKLDENRISLKNKIKFSHYASSKPATKLGIKFGDSISVRDAINSLIVLSANDVATAVGEYLGGSEANFSRIMNKKAKDLKMYNTHFSNASGLFHPAQHTTAADMVRIGIALKNDFPQYYKYFSKTEFNFRGNTIYGHNAITRDYFGAEGLKTGYISQSGYNLVSSASRNKKTVFASVMGGGTANERDLYMRKLLDASFSKMEGNKVRL